MLCDMCEVLVRMVCVQSRETPKDCTSFLGKQQIPKFVQQLCFILNHKNYNFFNCDLFKKLPLSTNSLAKLLLYSLLSDSSITNQSITTNLRVTLNNLNLFISLLMQIFPFFHNLAILFFAKTVTFMINWL